MGFGDIASATIMFITVLSAATLLAIVFNNYATSATSSISERQQAMSEQLKTDILIENVIHDAQANQTRIYVKNTGQTSMRLDYLGGFLADQRIRNATIEILEDTDLINTGVWDAKETILVTVNQSITSGQTYTAIIITEHGIRDEYGFSV